MQELTPDNTRAYNNLGSAFLQQERFDKATEMYERSLSLDKNATAYSNLGTALYQQGRYADAARSFEGAVALPGASFRALVQSRRRLLLGAGPDGARKRRTKPRSSWASRREPPRPGSIPPAWQNWPPDTRCWRCCRPGRKRRSIEAGRST